MTLRANPLTLIARPSLVEETTLSSPVLSIAEVTVKAARSFSLVGSMTVANAQSGAIYIAPPADVNATVTINMTAAASDLTYTAVNHGSEGNSITVTHVTPAGVTATLGVVVSGTDITINLGKAASAVNSTANAVKAAIEASVEASALVTVTVEGAGTGLVNAIASTNLAGGTHLVKMSLTSIKLSCTAVPIVASLMENYTIDVSAPSLTPINRYRASSNASRVVTKGLANATITGGTGPINIGVLSLAVGIPNQFDNYELAPGRNVVLAIPNAGGGASSVISYSINWYELQD